MTEPTAGDDTPDYDADLPGAETELAPSSAETTAHAAWALDDGPEWKPPFWTAGRITVVVASASAVLIVAVAGLAGYTLASRQSPENPPSAASQVSTPSVPLLDGLYQLDYLSSKRKINGTASGWDPDLARDTKFWAFRTACVEERCSATGVGVESDDHSVAKVPPVTATLRYLDGSWRQDPATAETSQQHCTLDGGDVGPGLDVEQSEWTLDAQADGSFSGNQLTTVLSGQCGMMGVVLDMPLTAKRIGDVPEGVRVPDPELVSRRPAPALRGDAGLDGLYRMTFKISEQTVAGRPTTGDSPDRSELWVFRSACADAGCAAAGAQVADDNPQQNTGIATVLRLSAGHWSQPVPVIQAPQPCPSGPDSETYTIDWSLVLQPDGELRGVSLLDVLAGGCGSAGNEYKTPVSGVRVGDVPLSVAIADPLLFASRE